jgi:hypothetical protein
MKTLNELNSSMAVKAVLARLRVLALMASKSSAGLLHAR